MDQNIVLETLDKKFAIAKKAISSGQNVEIFSNYYPQEERLELVIKIKKCNEDFIKLEEGMISKDQAKDLSKFWESAKLMRKET